MAQRLHQQRPADRTSLHPAVSSAKHREKQISGINRGAELETDSPGPDLCGQNTPVGNVTDWQTDHMVLVKIRSTTVFPSGSPSEKVAELSYVATLEDLGLVKAREVIVSESSQVRELGVSL